MHAPLKRLLALTVLVGVLPAQPKVEPAKSQPAKSQPAKSQPAKSQPAKSQPEKKQPADALDGPPLVNAKAWAVADGESGRFLAGVNVDQSLPMASTTKIMTALVAMRIIEADQSVFDETVSVSRFAGNTGGSSARLRPGDRVGVHDVIYGLLLPSGNDAANALAEHLGARLEPPADPDSIPWTTQSAGRSQAWINFVAEMNRESKRLGLRGTRFVNPHGLDATNHYSTARDLLVLARAAMAFPQIRNCVAERSHRATVVAASGSRRIEVWKSTNRLLDIEGFTGVKTGTTSQAGACLVSRAVRGDHDLFVVVLNSNNRAGRYIDTRNLFRWAFTQQIAGGK